jgi:hypothetical protein
MGPLGTVEERPNDAVVQLNDFIRDRGLGFEHYRNQCGLPTGRPELCQVCGGHMTDFARELEKAVLMHSLFDPIRQIQRLQGREPINMFKHVSFGFRARATDATTPKW